MDTEGGQTAVPAKKVPTKVSPHKELLLKEQAIITQAITACTKEETLAVKPHTLQVSRGNIKPGKA